MARIREEDYAYATAHIRAIEPKLINRSKLDRLLDAADASDTVRLLVESGYGSDQTDNSKDGAGKVEALLSSELKKAYNLLFEILPDPQPVNLFMRRYDYLNAKLILKAEFLGMDISKSLSPMGTLKAEKLLAIITGRNFSELPEIFGNAITESLEEFSQSGDPQAIDFILDRASFENMMIDAKKAEEPFLVDLTNRLSDIANIRVFLRAKLLKKSAGFIKRALVSSGTLPLTAFEELSEKSLEEFFAYLKKTGFENIAQDLSEAVKKPDGVSEVEKILDDSVIIFLRQSKFVTYGIDPVIAYLFYKETEIKNARLIITGKANKIPQETIKERLRLTYA